MQTNRHLKGEYFKSQGWWNRTTNANKEKESSNIKINKAIEAGNICFKRQGEITPVKGKSLVLCCP